MLTVPVRNILLHAPGATPVPITPAFHKLLADCKLWYALYGVDLTIAQPETLEAPINTANVNPWPEVAGWLMNHPDYDPEAITTVFLQGWSTIFIGWGGGLGLGGLSVVGDYAIERILSVPTTPDDATDAADGRALVDDPEAGRLWCHEVGHALRLPHDFTDDRYVMSYGSGGGAYNFIMGAESEQELHRLWTPQERDEDALEVRACRRPV